MSKQKKDDQEIEYTGRYIVLMPSNEAGGSSIASFNNASGLNLRSSTEFENEVFSTDDLDACDGIMLENIGVAIVSKNPKFENSLSAMNDSGQMIVERERVVYATNRLDEETENYVRGYRDAVNALANTLVADEETESLMDTEGVDIQSLGATWGLKATRVIPPLFFTNPYSGLNVKVAILDTGFDFNHPDFIGRPIVHRSFIPGQTTQDVYGHGTHCTGTACGPINAPGNFERYGIAHKARIYIGKVLNNLGSGTDGQILAGINWAFGQGCKVISMSLGARASNGTFSAIFQSTALSLLNQGTIIIAAAGNDSNRSGGITRPVSHPANCPSIMAVGAVDSSMNLANFTNRGIFPAHGAVDIVGPGVAVFSALSTPHNPGMGAVGLQRGNSNGTSMATPHVAGIAALWIEASGVTGHQLWAKLTTTAKLLPQHLVVDRGAGLVQAPNRRIFPRPFPGQPFPPVG